VSVPAFFFAGIIGLAGGASTSFSDLTIWGGVSLILAVLSYFGWREKRERRESLALARTQMESRSEMTTTKDIRSKILDTVELYKRGYLTAEQVHRLYEELLTERLAGR
jgi:membrane protein implicated in regulation of membrane protease activity